MTRTLPNDRHYRPDDPGAALALAALALRDAFADVPFDPAMDHCPHCVTPADLAALGASPAELAPTLVGRFVAKSGTTWGRPKDLRRVVPAVLELLADDQLTVNRELAWAKLRWAGWPDWTPHQVEAVDAFLAAEWDRLLRSQPRPAHAAYRWLADAGGGTLDLDPFLAAWHDALGPLTHPAHYEAAVGHLVDLLSESPLRPDLPDTMADVFPGDPHAAAQVTAWLVGPGTAHELQRATVVLANTRSARRVSVASERLRRFTAAVGGGPDPD